MPIIVPTGISACGQTTELPFQKTKFQISVRMLRYYEQRMSISFRWDGVRWPIPPGPCAWRREARLNRSTPACWLRWRTSRTPTATRA